MESVLQLFRSFSIWFKILLGELANNIISLLFIFAMYLSLWYFPQTIDLLLILNQADAFFLEIPLYFGSLTVAAFFIWNVPKYYYYHNYKDITIRNLIGFVPNKHYQFQKKSAVVSFPYRTKIHIRKTVPRVLAILLLLIASLSILNAMEEFNLDNFYTYYLHPQNTLLIAIIFLLLLTVPDFYEAIGRLWNKKIKSPYILPILSIGLLLFIISLGTLNIQTEQDLGKLFLASSALTILFATLSFNSYYFLSFFPKKIFYASILLSGFFIVILFFVLNFHPELSAYINPLSILVFSLLSLFIICFLLILGGKKIKLPLLTLVFIFVVFSARFFTQNSDHYQLKLVKTLSKRNSIEQYIYQWIDSRKEEILDSKKFPVLLVSAEGGGSRAGLWSFLVHSYLQESSKGTYFNRYLLSLTGASGGGVGNGLFFSSAMEAKKNGLPVTYSRNPDEEFPFRYKASLLYRKNYLSEALLSLTGRDLLKEITGLFQFRNRGELLQDAWSDTYKEIFSPLSAKSPLQRDILSFYQKINVNSSIPQDFIPPLLFVNTTHTQTGTYNTIGPVTFNEHTEFKGVTDFIQDLQDYYPESSISLASALRINASFPYITPVGEVKKTKVGRQEVKTDQYADAGYYDNIGGVVSLGIEQVFRKVIQKSFPELVDKIAIKQVLIMNEKQRKIAKTETQFAAPLTTLGNVRYGHTYATMERLGFTHAIQLKRTAIRPKLSTFSLWNEQLDSTTTIQPILPLGRYLSTIAIRSMEARLDTISGQLDSLLLE
ncbi:hypothetical protein NBT05_13910 [Aquimarina sp. ERC-38]|uniref:hypothetical protein n=1 Tax=Aquimarina sp. ERC-38 TaxID=2949996 RepID=UPI002246CB6D|nr:hypothetical protein [Aquimarina sp. ERC-38]UZO80038.1 hypothetical protein NBT05_13910 [Aquimarina sp. ERC-38]